MVLREEQPVVLAEEEPSGATLEIGGRRVALRWTGDGSLTVDGGESKQPGTVVLEWPAHSGEAELDVQFEYLTETHAQPLSVGFDDAAESTHEYFAAALAKCNVLAPDRNVLEAAAWARVNILRSVFDFPIGLGVSNNITRDYLVSRDTSWIAMGVVYFDAQWAKDLLRVFNERCLESGLMIEYVRGIGGETETYDMDIIDNNPLHVIAVEHVARTTADDAFAEESYEIAARCAQYILDQRDSDGLVSVRARGYANWGICSWRNVINGYRLDGAVTEVNAHSYAALLAMERLAVQAGHAENAERWRSEAKTLRGAVRQHLRDDVTGLYARNRDSDGVYHWSRTGDAVFPLLFDIEPAALDGQLLRPEDIGPRGVRTVPIDAPEYHPMDGFGLLGGSWPDLNIWWSRAALDAGSTDEAADLLDRTVRVLWEGASANSVPGEFPEYFCGASGSNRGMYLSPWVAPKLIWLLVDGFAGVDVSADGVSVTPRLPSSWPWMAVERVQTGGGAASVFILGSSRTIYVDAPTAVSAAEGWEVRRVSREILVENPTEGVIVRAFRVEETSEIHVVALNATHSHQELEVRISGGAVSFALAPREAEIQLAGRP